MFQLYKEEFWGPVPDVKDCYPKPFYDTESDTNEKNKKIANNTYASRIVTSNI